MRIPVIGFREDADLNPNGQKDGRFGLKAAVDPMKAAKTKLSLQRSELKAMERKREEVAKLYGEDALPEELEEIPQDFDIEEIPSEGKE